MSDIIEIYFSPSQTTKKVVGQVASNFSENVETYDLLTFSSEKEFSPSDIVIVGIPIFAGRIPKSGRERLSKLKGKSTKAIAIANYGNAHVTDALLELVDLLTENNFDVIAAATTVSHHSILTALHREGRTVKTWKKLMSLQKNALKKLKTAKALKVKFLETDPTQTTSNCRL